MNAIAIMEIGIEHVCQEELRETTGVKGQTAGGVLLFSTTPEKIIQFCYQTQSANRVLLLLSSFEAHTDLKKTTASLQKQLPATFPLDIPSTIRVDCEREGFHSWSSIDAETEFGEIILNTYHIKNASMKSPDMVLYAYIRGTKGYIGIDLTGRNLAKRNYKIFSMPATIRGTLAYALLKISNYTQTQTILDPFCGSGTIPIEAALISTRTSPNYYNKEFPFIKLLSSHKPTSILAKIDKQQKTPKKKKIHACDKELRHVQSATKNAKIAGIEKNIDFSRCDIEWLDTKFEKNSIDLIITEPPHDSKHTAKEREKLFKEFFYQAAFILKKNGRILLLSNTPLPPESSKNEGFQLIKTHNLSSGQQPYTALIYTR